MIRQVLVLAGDGSVQRVPAAAFGDLGVRPVVTCRYSVVFFFSSRRRHTRFDCDWSSDVCSSDLLSTLSVWWVQLGIRPELIEPAHPEQNGRHERMHKTLKAETARPPRRTLAAQQRRFDWFRQRYNTERPHEALGQRLPASLYQASARPYPATLLPITYPGHYAVRRVSRNGGIRWGSCWVNVSHVLAELDVGFEEIDDGLS